MSDVSFGPNDLPLYDALAKRLEAEGDYAGVERATRAMLTALEGSKLPIVRILWRRLRDLHRDRLGDLEGAITAGKHVARTWPGDFDDLLTLARLLAANGQRDEAEARYAVLPLIRADSMTIRELIAYRMLEGDFDGASAATSVLASFSGLTEDEELLLQRAPRGLPTGQLDRPTWEVFAPLPIGTILEHIAAPIVALQQTAPVVPAAWDRRYVVHKVATPQFRAAFACATRALGIPTQAHFADPEPNASFAPLQAPLDDETRELLFVAGRHAAFHRPAPLLLFLHSSMRELMVFLSAARLAIDEKAPVPDDLRAPATDLANHLCRTMSVPAQLSLAEALRQFTAWDTLESSVQIFRTLEDSNAARAGLLLCGDLRIAESALSVEPPAFGATTTEEKMKDLRHFALTKRYTDLRRRLYPPQV